MKKYRITRCLCWKGELLSTSINNPRCQEDAGIFTTKEMAEEWKKKLQEMEANRIKRDRESARGWNGNEFVFWIDEV